MPFTRRRLWAPEQPAGTYREGIFFTWQTPDVGGPEIQLANDASRVTAAVQIQYEDIDEFCKDAIGFSRVITVTVGDPPVNVRIHARQVPLVYPDITDEDGNPYLYAQSIARVEGIGPLGADPITRAPRYNLARVWITFASLNYKIFEDFDAPMLDEDSPTLGNFPDEATLARYVSRASDPFDRAISLPTGFVSMVPVTGANPDYRATGTNTFVPYAANEPGPPVIEGAGLLQPGLDVVRTHHLIPEVPLNTILRTVGKVNSVTFDGFPPETLVCLAPRIRSYISPLGKIVFDVSYRFRLHSKEQKTGVSVPTVVGHNHLLRRVVRAADGSAVLDYRLHTVGGKPTGPRIYEAVDFHDLFRPDQGTP